MEHFIYIFTRIVLFACITIIGYLFAVPEKGTADDWDI
jgi:hypothetical protein